MTYKETLLFIGKCLTISHEEKNKLIVEKELKSERIDWDFVVEVSTAHYVFPALYCNLKRTDFLHYLPEELVNYMIYITDLNRERNQQIIAQAKELNELLLANNITPIFLKGTGNLLEGLYEDVAERMVGDIDFIVSKENYEKTINILEVDSYYKLKKNKKTTKHNWHYPRLIKKGKIAAVEIHNKVLKKPYSNVLSFKMINKDALIFDNIKVASYKNQILNNVLPKQINDNLYHSKEILLKTVLDLFLIHKKYNGNFPKTNIKKINIRFNHFILCVSFLLNKKRFFNAEETISSRKYLKRFKLALEDSRKERIRIFFLYNYVRIKDYFKILQYSFVDKNYRNYTFSKLKNISFYLRNLMLKKVKPNL